MKHCRGLIFPFAVVIAILILFFPAHAKVTVSASVLVDYKNAVNATGGIPMTRVVVMIKCDGATSPRLGWGETKWFYTSSMLTGDGKIEAPGVRIGGGEVDKAEMVLESEWTNFAGAVVTPILERVSCLDLDNKAEQEIKTNITGRAFYIPPYIEVLGYSDPDDPTQMFDPEHLPADRFVHPVLRINAHPSGDECLLILGSVSNQPDSDGRSTQGKFNVNFFLPRVCGPKFRPYSDTWGAVAIRVTPDALASVDSGIVLPNSAGFVTPAKPGARARIDMTAQMRIDDPSQRTDEFDVLADGFVLEFGLLSLPFLLGNTALNALQYQDMDHYYATWNVVLLPKPWGITTLGEVGTDRVRDADSLASADPTKASVGQAFRTRDGLSVSVDKLGFVPTMSGKSEFCRRLEARLNLRNTGKGPYPVMSDQIKATFLNEAGIERDSLYNVRVKITSNGKELPPVTSLPPGATLPVTITFLTRLEQWNELEPQPKTLFLGVEDLVLSYDTARLPVQ